VERVEKSGRRPMTIGQAGGRWWEEFRQCSEESDLKAWIDWMIAQLKPTKPLHTITDDDVARLISGRRKVLVYEGRDDEGKPVYRLPSNCTINRTTVKLLRQIMLKAVKSWNVEVLRMPDWKEHVLPEGRNLPRPLRFEEEPQLAAAERDELTKVRLFATMSSLRLAEVVSLSKFNIDFSAGKISVYQKGRRPRVVPITPAMEAPLRAKIGHHVLGPEYLALDRQPWDNEG
jgi:integrase